ncbi:MAG: C39 family peptidase [Chloroflexi bacterium]|nr:C39 family peptidase [Chloroflexota bacterium]
MSLTFLPQETRYSCTVACLRMVMAHFDISIEESELRECCKTTEQGTLAREAVKCAQQHGLNAKEMRDVSWDDAKEILAHQTTYPIALINLFPIKALWVMHAVVIESIDDDLIAYLDPIYGKQSVNIISFGQAWEMNGRRAIVITR